MAKKYPGLYLYYDWIAALEKIPAKKAMNIIKNLRDYARDGIEPPSLDGHEGSLQDLFMAQIKRSAANAEHGRQGGLISRKKAEAAKENPPSEEPVRLGMTPEEIQAVGYLDYLKIKARMEEEVAALADPETWNDLEEPSSAEIPR